jgi:ribonuclease HII
MTQHIIGSDECGYGSWAGPLFVCAFIAPTDWSMPGVADSKTLSPARRETLAKQLDPGSACIMQVSSAEIDRWGVAVCLLEAHTVAIETLRARWGVPARIIVDGNLRLPRLPDAEALPKADSLIPAVSAASIMGKVAHDARMRELATQYPGYGFDTHMGYGTPAHLAALQKLGVTPEHRRSYSAVRNLLGR